VHVKYDREIAVTGALALMDYQVEIPMDFRTYPRRRNGFTPPPKDVPMLRCQVLVRLKMEDFTILRDCSRHITGWDKDAEGNPDHIPDHDMAVFVSTYREWRLKVEKQAADGKAGLGVGRAAKRRSMGFYEALNVIQRRMGQDT